MKILGSLAVLVSLGTGMFLYHSRELIMVVYEIGPDGTWSVTGVVSAPSRQPKQYPGWIWETQNRGFPVEPDDSICRTRIWNRTPSTGFESWSVERSGKALEHTYGKAGHYATVWGLTLTPALMGLLGVIVARAGDKRREGLVS